MSELYYETMYILRPDIPEEEVETHVNKYRDLVTEAGAEVYESQMRGKRRLAYTIAKHKEGIYVQLTHNGDGQQVIALERAMRLSEDVIRYLTVKQDGPVPPPRTGSVAVATTSTTEEATASVET
jgi:small subunit ribosomal protein S6